MLEIQGKLQVKFSKTLNRSGQRPLEIIFEGPDEQRMEIMGVRFMHGTMLDAVAVLPGGSRVMRHTRFSPELQVAVKQARAKEADIEQQDFKELAPDE